jgi:hypothetical protein
LKYERLFGKIFLRHNLNLWGGKMEKADKQKNKKVRVILKIKIKIKK